MEAICNVNEKEKSNLECKQRKKGAIRNVRK